MSKKVPKTGGQLKNKNTHRKNLLVNTTLGSVSLRRKMDLGPRPYAEMVLAETLEIERKYEENINLKKDIMEKEKQ